MTHDVTQFETKAFPARAVLTVIAGPLMCDISEVYTVLSWIAGESVYTHQLGRFADEAKPVVLALHPELQQAVDEADKVTPDNWQSWADTWEKRYGTEITVPRLTAEQHKSIDPISELRARGIEPIVVVVDEPAKPL